MGWRAGAETESAKGGKSKRSIYVILVGLVVAGAAATWKWVRKLPK